MTLPPDDNEKTRHEKPPEPEEGDAQVGISDSNLEPPPKAPDESAIPEDSILGSAAEPPGQGRGILPTDHPIHEKTPDPDKTLPMGSDDIPVEIPEDSIMQDLAEPASQIIDLKAEHQSIRLTPDTMIQNRFRVIRQLGEGGMGAVYLVEDTQLSEQRALKIILPRLVNDTMAQQRFLTEIKVLQKLSHESIVRVHDLGVDEKMGLQFFTMENVAGKTLHQHIYDCDGRLPQDEVIDISQKLCRALSYAHGKTIHRDLKPANVMIDEEGKITILDFGLAKLLDPGFLAHSNMVMGTFHYQSPEQRTDPASVNHRTDLFSLGIMMYEMLTGEIPAGSFEPPSRLVKGVSKKLDRVVMKCLQNRQERRFQSAQELWEELEAAKSGFRGFGLPLPRPKLPEGMDDGSSKTRPRSVIQAAERIIPGPPPVKRAGAILILVGLCAMFVAIVYLTWFTVDLETAQLQAEEARKAAQDSLRVQNFSAEEILAADAHWDTANLAVNRDSPRIATREFIAARDGYRDSMALATQREEVWNDKLDQVKVVAQEARDARDRLGDPQDIRVVNILTAANAEKSIAIAAQHQQEPDGALQSYEKVMALYENAAELTNSINREAELQETLGGLNRAEAEAYAKSDLEEAEAFVAKARAAEDAENYTGAAEFLVLAKAQYETVIANTENALASAQQGVINLKNLALEAQGNLPDDVRDYAAEKMDLAARLLPRAVEAESAGNYVEAERLFDQLRETFVSARNITERGTARIQLARDRANTAKIAAEQARDQLAESARELAPGQVDRADTLLADASSTEANDPAGAADLYRQAFRAYGAAQTDALLAEGDLQTQKVMVVAKNLASSARGGLPPYAANYSGEALQGANELFSQAEASEKTGEYVEAREVFKQSEDRFIEAASVAKAGYERDQAAVRTARGEAATARESVNSDAAIYASEKVAEAARLFDQAEELENSEDLAQSVQQFQLARASYEEAGDLALQGLQTAVARVRREVDAARASAETVQSQYKENDEERGLNEYNKGADLLTQAAAEAGKGTLSDLRLSTRLYKDSRNEFQLAKQQSEAPSRMQQARQRMEFARAEAENAKSEFPGAGEPFGQDSLATAEATYEKAKKANEAGEVDSARGLYRESEQQFLTAKADYEKERRLAIEDQVAAKSAADDAKKAYFPNPNNQGREAFLAAQAKYGEAETLTESNDFLGATPLYNEAAEAFQVAIMEANAPPPPRPEPVVEPVATPELTPPSSGTPEGFAATKQKASQARDKILNNRQVTYDLRPKTAAQKLWDDALKLEGAGDLGAAKAKFEEAYTRYNALKPKINTRRDR